MVLLGDQTLSPDRVRQLLQHDIAGELTAT